MNLREARRVGSAEVIFETRTTWFSVAIINGVGLVVRHSFRSLEEAMGYVERSFRWEACALPKHRTETGVILAESHRWPLGYDGIPEGFPWPFWVRTDEGWQTDPDALHALKAQIFHPDELDFVVPGAVPPKV